MTLRTDPLAPVIQVMGIMRVVMRVIRKVVKETLMTKKIANNLTRNDFFS